MARDSASRPAEGRRVARPPARRRGDASRYGHAAPKGASRAKASARGGAAMPRASRDPERTRARILAAATREFARYGLGGARVDRIAEAAEANKRMLYYYYGDKDALFLAVLEQAYADIRAAEQALHLIDVEPEEAIRRLVAFTWHYYIDHPEFLRLLNSENLHRAAHLKESASVRATNSPLIASIRRVLARGEKAGVFRGGVDPLQLYISIAGLAWFYLSNNHTLSAVFDRDLATPRARATRLAHMQAVILGYLRPA